MASEERRHRAVLVGINPHAESDAVVRLFADGHGALVARARGLRKAGSKLAPRLQPADELEVRITAGRGGVGLLIGVEPVRAHPHWRADLGLLALYWFMAECLYVGASEEQVNADMYRLLANLLRSEPAGDLRYGAAAVFCLKLLGLHGLLAELRCCALDGHPLAPDEPAHLLPQGDGLVGRAAYNEHYARSGGGMLRLDAERRQRWQALLTGALLDYPAAAADQLDAALLVQHAARLLGSTAATSIRSVQFLVKQWQLPTIEELLRDQHL